LATPDLHVCQLKEAVDKAQSWELQASQCKEQLSKLEASIPPCSSLWSCRRLFTRRRSAHDWCRGVVCPCFARTSALRRKCTGATQRVAVGARKGAKGEPQRIGAAHRGRPQHCEESLVATGSGALRRGASHCPSPSASKARATSRRCAQAVGSMARADGTSSLPTSADNPQPPRPTPGSVQLVDGASANESTPRRPSLLPVEETREVAAYSLPSVHPRKRFALRCPAGPGSRHGLQGAPRRGSTQPLLEAGRDTVRRASLLLAQGLREY
jgi:hypothetical protein